MPRRSIDRLTVSDKDAVFWDRDLPGFGVRVHATGRKVYVVQSRGPAGLKRVTLGPYAGISIEDRRQETAGSRNHRPHQARRRSAAAEACARAHGRRSCGALPVRPFRSQVQTGNGKGLQDARPQQGRNHGKICPPSARCGKGRSRPDRRQHRRSHHAPERRGGVRTLRDGTATEDSVEPHRGGA